MTELRNDLYFALFHRILYSSGAHCKDVVAKVHVRYLISWWVSCIYTCSCNRRMWRVEWHRYQWLQRSFKLFETFLNHIPRNLWYIGCVYIQTAKRRHRTRTYVACNFSSHIHRCKKRFLTFLLWSRFYVFYVFYFVNVFFIFKNVGNIGV